MENKVGSLRNIEHYNYVEKIETMHKQIDLLFEKVASLRESVLKLEQNGPKVKDS